MSDTEVLPTVSEWSTRLLELYRDLQINTFYTPEVLLIPEGYGRDPMKPDRRMGGGTIFGMRMEEAPIDGGFIGYELPADEDGLLKAAGQYWRLGQGMPDDTRFEILAPPDSGSYRIRSRRMVMFDGPTARDVYLTDARIRTVPDLPNIYVGFPAPLPAEQAIVEYMRGQYAPEGSAS